MSKISGNMTNTKTNKRKKTGLSSIFMAMLTAVLVWTTFYLLASQALVLWHWDLVNHPPIETIVETRVEVPYKVIVPASGSSSGSGNAEEYEDDEYEEDEIIATAAAAAAIPAVLLDEDSKLRQLNLIRQIAEAQARQSNMLVALKQRVSVLEYNVKQTHQPTTIPDLQDTPPTMEVPIESLTTLLTKPTLQTTDDTTLETLLTQALQELQAAIDQNITTDKTNAGAQLLTLLTQTHFVRDKPLAATSSNCPATPDGARHSDLRATLSTMLHGLTEQRKGRSVERLLVGGEGRVTKAALEEQIKKPLPEGSVMEQQLLIDDDEDDDDDDVVVAPTPAPTSSKLVADQNGQDKICLMPDDLEAMVELAMKSHAADLQSALTKFVQQIEPESQLILDAVLPRSSNNNKSTKKSTAPTTNLRQALNSEWIWQATTSFVDAVVDKCGGYLEPLDAAVDSLASDGESVGRVVVSRLLQAAAAVPVPGAASNHNQSKAGMLHHT